MPQLNGAIEDLPGVLQAVGFEAPLITLAHRRPAGGYIEPHRDPSDRMLAAPADLKRLVLLTAELRLSTFLCQRLW